MVENHKIPSLSRKNSRFNNRLIEKMKRNLKIKEIEIGMITKIGEEMIEVMTQEKIWIKIVEIAKEEEMILVEIIEKIEDQVEIGLILGKIDTIKRATKEDGAQEVDQDQEVDLIQTNLGVVNHGMNWNREVDRVRIIEQVKVGVDLDQDIRIDLIRLIPKLMTQIPIEIGKISSKILGT